MRRRELVLNRAQLGSLALAAAVIGVVSTLVVQGVSAAGIPEAGALTYSGVLEKPDGTPVTEKVNLRVSLWNAASGPAELCSQSKSDVTLLGGRFQLELPDACRDAIAANPNVWVQVEAGGASLGRTKLGAVPYAVEAANAGTASAAAGALKTQIDAMPKMSAWTTFAPTVHREASGFPAVTQGATPPSAGRWRRVGDSLEIVIESTLAGYENNNDTLLWRLPDSLQAASSLPVGSKVGFGTVNSGGAIARVVNATDRRHLALFYDQPLRLSSLPPPYEGGIRPPSRVHFRATVPIQGWTVGTP